MKSLWTPIYAVLNRYGRVVDAEGRSLSRRIARRLSLLMIQHLPEFPARVRYCGRRFHFPSKSAIGHHIAEGQTWDRELLDVLNHIGLAPRLIVEVGSNIGGSIVPVKLAFPDANLLAIEPACRYRNYLRANLAGLSSVTIVDDRLMADSGRGPVELRTNSTTGTPSEADYGSEITSSEVLPTDTVDELLSSLRASKSWGDIDSTLDLIKVDTDGFEERVFRGAQRSILEHKPLIFAEFSPPSLARVGDPKDLIDYFLNELECEFFVVFSSGGKLLGQAKSYKEIMELKGPACYVDFMAAPIGSRYCEPLRQVSISERLRK
jgi:FkbM family methyltransferase